MPLALGLALIALQSSPAVTAPSPAAPPAIAAKPTRDADPMVCQEEQVTGSMFPKRTCKPRSEWNAASRDADGYRDAQRQQTQRMSGH